MMWFICGLCLGAALALAIGAVIVLLSKIVSGPRF